MQNQNNFQTSEYYLAVTLLTLKEEIIDMQKNISSNKAIFLFKTSPTLNKNINDFRQSKILVEPQNLFMQHKLLKNRLYDYQEKLKSVN